MKDREFCIVDVFGQSSYTGNQLAVIEDASGLSSSQMQKIAREFNFSESTFITSREKSKFCVRIFTPKNELPFAGHPTLGTAWVIQQKVVKKKVPTITLSLKIGEIPVIFQYSRSKPSVLWMKQKEPTFGEIFNAGPLSNVLGVLPEDFDQRFPIQIVSTGVPFFIVPLKTLRALKACKIANDPYSEMVSNTVAKSILVFSPEAYHNDSDLSVRVFTQYYGIPEDPATGSGNGCLAAYLSKYKYFGKNKIDVSVDQGYEVGRPSKLLLKTTGDKNFGVVVGGRVFFVARGKIAI